MSDVYIFQKYPLEERLPYHFDITFEWAQETALKVLANRDHKEIAQLAMDIDALIFTELPYLDISSFPQGIYTEPANLYPGRTQVMRLQIGVRNDNPASSISALKQLTWAECFAAQILSQIAFACYDEDRYKHDNASLGYDDPAENTGMYALACMELLTMMRILPGTEALFPPETLFPEIKAKKRRTAQKAAGAKHAATGRIKADFVTWYLENIGSGIFHSKAQAAEKFHVSLSEEDQKILTNPNTLIRGLRAHLKANKTT